MIVIALGNRARHGKDTAAEAIIGHARKMLYPTMKLSWAAALREEANQWLAANPAWQFGDSGIKTLADGTPLPEWVKPTPNAVSTTEDPYGKHSLLLQWWGTDYRRATNPHYWVEKGMKKISAFTKNGVVVVPDTRFINEVDAIERWFKGISIQVTRLNQDGTPFRDPGRDPNHPSEITLDDYNWQHKIVSKSAALTAELAITIFEFERGLRGF